MCDSVRKMMLMGLISSTLFSTKCYASETGDALLSDNSIFPLSETITEYNGVTIDSNGKIIYNFITKKREDNTEETEVKIQLKKERKKLSNRIKQALVENASEIKESIERKITEDLFMTIVKDTIDGNEVFISHIIVDDPDKMEKLIANGGYDRGREKVTSMAAAAGAIWACNGSHYDLGNCSTQDYRNNNITIVNGEVVHNAGCSLGMEICYTKDGDWFTAPKGATAQTLLDMGVIETYSSIQMPILEHGSVVQPTNYAEEEELNKTYIRTIIGQTDDKEIYVLTGKTKTRSAAEYLKNKGCNWAKSLDMGGSVTLYANGKLINEPTDEEGERAVIDGIGILR